MSKYKILFKITGSIAAYKSAYLISKLVQNDCEVKCVVTNSALNFIGTATLEGLTGNCVLVDGFEQGEMMSHINLMKWADLTIVAPASGNTINKFAAGIADNLVTSLFLAHDRSKPYLIAPAMNTAMYNHPATQDSLKKLEGWGIKILPTEEGRLACGDVGKGKLIDPEIIFKIIMDHLHGNSSGDGKPPRKILVTSGGTKESIDGVRFIGNMSTGKTGSAIADYFFNEGWQVTFLCAENSALPRSNCKRISFYDYHSLETKLFEMISQNTFDAVIHLAAVSDFKIDNVEYGNKIFTSPVNEKIPSTVKEIKISLTSTEKIVDGIKQKSTNKNLILTAFKFTTNSGSYAEKEVTDLFSHSHSDYVVLNHPAGRTAGGEQRDFKIFEKNGAVSRHSTVEELARQLEQKFLNEIKLRGG